MTLAAAIRAGARRRPQAIGVYFDDTGSCVLGAAYEAVTEHPDPRAVPTREVVAGLTQHFPELYASGGHCPDCAKRYRRLRTLLSHLNDLHFWTREQIAAWLEERKAAA